MNPGWLACPQCCDIGLVQKVTAIIDSGTATTWGGGLAIGTAGLGGGLGESKTETQLIKKLDPPARPSEPARLVVPEDVKPSEQPRITLHPLIFVLFAAMSYPSSGLGFLFFLGIAALIWFYQYRRLTNWRMAQPRIRAENAKRKREHESSLQEWTNGPFAQWQQEVASWERAMERWNRLFYCARCDGIFIPGERGFTPIGQMQQALFKMPPNLSGPSPENTE